MTKTTKKTTTASDSWDAVEARRVKRVERERAATLRKAERMMERADFDLMHQLVAVATDYEKPSALLRAMALRLQKTASESRFSDDAQKYHEREAKVLNAAADALDRIVYGK